MTRESVQGHTPRVWDVPRDAQLGPIFEWCLERHGVDRLLVVERSATANGRHYTFDSRVTASVGRIFGTAAMQKFRAARWPGRQVFGHRERVHLIRFDSEVAARMLSVEPTLRGWQHGHPLSLPEDPCLFRAGDDLPVLLSVTIHSEAWIVSEDRPSVPGISPSDATVPELYIPPPPTFVDRGPIASPPVKKPV